MNLASLAKQLAGNAAMSVAGGVLTAATVASAIPHAAVEKILGRAAIALAAMMAGCMLLAILAVALVATGAYMMALHTTLPLAAIGLLAAAVIAFLVAICYSIASHAVGHIRTALQPPPQPGLADHLQHSAHQVIDGFMDGFTRARTDAKVAS